MHKRFTIRVLSGEVVGAGGSEEPASYPLGFGVSCLDEQSQDRIIA
jgi:hypothetical protein